MFKTATYLSDDLPTTSLKKVVRIKKPASNSSKEIRNNILRDEFDYSPEEIRDFNTEYPNDYFIGVDKKLQWASMDEVKNWKPELKDGLVPIVLTDLWVQGVWDFKRKRAAFEIFKVSILITDAEISEEFRKDLEAILSSFGEKRIMAFANLMNLIAGSLAHREQIFKALRLLSTDTGYESNPFLYLADIKAKSGLPGTTWAWKNLGAVGAVVTVNRQLYTENPKITRQEAAELNRYISVLYTELNQHDQATKHRWMERILNMPDSGRLFLKEGDIYTINPPGAANSMRGTYPSEADLRQTEKELFQEQEEFKKQDMVGTDQSFTMRGDHRQNEYGQRATPVIQLLGNPAYDKNIINMVKEFNLEMVPMNETKTVKDRTQPKGKSKREIVTGVNYNNIYQITGKDGYSVNARASAFGSPLTLYLEYAKYLTTHRRMQIITHYLRQKEKLERRIALDYFRVVPPPVDVIEKYIRDLKRDGRITVDRNQKVKIFGVLSELESLLEESRAFAKRR